MTGGDNYGCAGKFMRPQASLLGGRKVCAPEEGLEAGVGAEGTPMTHEIGVEHYRRAGDR